MNQAHRLALHGARLVLAIWAVGLVIAAFELGAWRQELSATLMQLNADARFLARVQTREGVDPEWYRRKALALLSATERLRRDAAWSLFIPGSWSAFDNLEERVQARMEREFGEIVAETLRRELVARGSQLTGAPLGHAGSLSTAGGECEPPAPSASDQRVRSGAGHAPELDAVAAYVASVRQLDDALHAYLGLHRPTARPEQLHKLVRYALDKELPVALARSTRLFQVSDAVNVAPALLRSQLQWAARCSLLKGMALLHDRALHTSELFRLEQALAEHSAGLFDSGARMAPSARMVGRFRAVRALLDAEHDLLAQGNNAWMRSGQADFGPGYAGVLAAIEATPLLGPQVLHQVQQQSAAAFADFRRRFERTFGDEGGAGIVWLETEQRFGLSADREGLRAGLAALLQLPFVSGAQEGRKASRSQTKAALDSIVAEASSLAEAHARFGQDGLPLFPEPARAAVARFVDARASELIYQKAHAALKAGWAAGGAAAWDAARLEQQRNSMAAVQSILKDTGGTYFAARLRSAFDEELVRQLASLHETWRQQSALPVRGSDFAWWQGEPLPMAQAPGATQQARPSLATLAGRLHALGQRAKALLSAAGPALAGEPVAQRWLALLAELERYHARREDSSIARMERYFGALGLDLRRDNCHERLAAHAPQGPAQDDIAQRHLEIHAALVRRCLELQAAPAMQQATSDAR